MKTTFGRARRPAGARRGKAIRMILTAAILAVATGPGPLGAQNPRDLCPAERREAWLGISSLTCSRCELHSISPTESDWSFATEPEISRVDPKSPAAGVLRPGDLLVGIDGHLITSREGGRRFGRVQPGDRVTIRFRRDGEVHSAVLTAAARCLSEDLPEAPGIPPLPEVDNVLDRLVGPPGNTPAAPLPEVPAAAETPPAPRLPSPGAYLGLSFRCGDCSARVREDRVVWSFSAPLEVLRVEPGGPADRAGLRAGDLIRGVDGAPIESRRGGEAFGRMSPGERVRLTISRSDGSAASLFVTPREPEPRPEADRAGPPPSVTDVVRYEGVLGPAHISVTGARVSVLAEQGTGLLIIRTADNEIRIRVPMTEGRREP